MQFTTGLERKKIQRFQLIACEKKGGRRRKRYKEKEKKHVKIARIGTNKSDDGKFSFD